jgi:secreted PhoX family phosphatase
VVLGSSYNRRITATTPIQITGPAAGHPWLQTAADRGGQHVLGTLNNCSAGITPWGTVLTCEENFNQYFANADMLPDSDPRKATHRRYGLPAGASERKWERFDPRFDLAQEPNEPFRFGWTLEVDPYDPTAIPRKRTALGRFKHEAASFLVGSDGRVGIYMGDDERFDYVYKFVTAGRYDPNNRAANRDLLDAGVLYVARFNDDGTGEWLPLVFGQGPLTAANGWQSQADVLIRTRLAADALGATKMDRPEDIEVSPVTKKIYAAMTNNSNRTETQVNKANPRPANRHGHIIEMAEQDDDPAATRFTWSIFMLCGDPADESTYFAGFDKSQVTPISSPDNLIFDAAGNLWIFTDGQPSTIRRNDAVFAVPTEGADRGHLRPFCSGVPGAETASGCFSADGETLFVSIQHPGEGGSLEQPISRWPDGSNVPRPSVVALWKTAPGEKRIGS